MQPRLIKVEPAVRGMMLRLTYETGEVKLFDATPYASNPSYEELKEDKYFQTVHLQHGGTGVEWEHGQAIASHKLYENSVPVSSTPTNR